MRPVKLVVYSMQPKLLKNSCRISSGIPLRIGCPSVIRHLNLPIRSKCTPRCAMAFICHCCLAGSTLLWINTPLTTCQRLLDHSLLLGKTRASLKMQRAIIPLHQMRGTLALLCEQAKPCPLKLRHDWHAGQLMLICKDCGGCWINDFWHAYMSLALRPQMPMMSELNGWRKWLVVMLQSKLQKRPEVLVANPIKVCFPMGQIHQPYSWFCLDRAVHTRPIRSLIW